ncbi:MAG: ABC transporter permease [Planctomycetota bacterium]
MNAYCALFGARFRELLQYRAAAIAGFVTQLFWGLIRIMIFEAFYRVSSAPQPMRFEEVVTYVWLSQAFLMLIPFRMDGEAMQKVRDGSVVYELARPVDLYGLWFARALALRLAPTLLRAVPLLAVAACGLGLQAPASWTAGAAGAASLAAAFLLAAALTALVTTSLFWTVSGEGLARLLPLTIWICSGIVLPLPFFPDWLQRVLEWLPFQGLIDVPFRLYLGHLPPEAALAQIGKQLAWTAALALLGRGLLSRGLRRLEVQGG